MGQYYKICNIDKHEYIWGHPFGDSMKLMDMGRSSPRTLCGLAILLADGNGRGGGDLHVPETCPESLSKLIGSWAGDRIVVAGDYADPGTFLPADATTEARQRVAEAHFSPGYQKPENVNLYAWAEFHYQDISYPIVALLISCGEFKIEDVHVEQHRKAIAALVA